MIKVIFTTIVATFIVIAFVTSMFLNSILGIFGLISTSLDSFNSLQESKQIMGEIKKRHKTKKLNAPKKFVTRSSKKIASSAVTAATIGTAGVVIVVAGFEVYDYCEDKKELLADENILFKTNKEFDYSKCLNDAQKDSNEIIILVKEAVPEIVASAWEDTKDISNETWESTKEISADAWASTSDATSRWWESLNDWVN